ncbi:hypothetical protein [Pedobacter sp. Leaf194]|uniref:hypothetical protein n=1 Tax=Pedobacter sp. Leaf194 TaxID=1736297 RepID=UPI0007030EB0|nr:hypothetical protein [Pedobacter sp. Leaf194]KQS36179.1 hypothetical protein ASG14_12160 [Pedobacter sp. Leaf194]
MQTNYDWLLKKTPRSVRNLHLWEQNPRLDPENTYTHLKEFAEEMTIEDSDRRDFIGLARSIVKKGFIPADPIVIWQNPDNKKFFVAEGNRRICVLKLLQEPHKSPKGIKNAFTKLSKEIDLTTIEKIHVSIAPTFEDAEWYISQRNSITSLQKRWQREQQQRWVAELYDKYEGDINIIRAQAGVDENDLESILRTLKLKGLVKEVEDKLTDVEYTQASSHRFPISSLERFFNSKRVKDDWGLEFDGVEIRILSKKDSFLNAYAALIKRMLLPRGNDSRIDSRSITEKLDQILDTLPKVESANNEDQTVTSESKASLEKNEQTVLENPASVEDEPAQLVKHSKKDLKNDPNRSRLILECYQLHTDNYRLADLFDELKTIPLKYRNAVAASIRIFLDLAVLTYIETESLEAPMQAKYKVALRQITLSKRLEFLKDKLNQKSSSITQKLLNTENELSLDVLNGYIHNHDSHFLDLPFLNKFWDFLFPLFQELLDIKEI